MYPFRLGRSLLRVLAYVCCVGGLMTVLSSCASSREASGPPGAASPPAAVSREQYREKATESFQKGAFAEEISNLQEVLRASEKDGDEEQQCDLLMKLSQAYEGIGEYGKSLQSLERALVLARKLESPARIASILGGMGNVYIALGPEQLAYRYLNEGLSVADKLGDPRISSAILNDLGSLFASQNRYEEAAGAYAKSASLAKAGKDHPLAATALTNLATALMHEGRYSEAGDALDKALEETGNLTPSHRKAYVLINIALGYQNIDRRLAGSEKQLPSPAVKIFMEAADICEAIDDPRGMSYALGYLGRLREGEQEYREALALTERALDAARRVSAPESLYRWEWQKGRLLKALGQIEGAISSYRRASSTLESIREEMSNCYGKPHASFRESAGPLYLEFVDLLLQRAASFREQKQYEPYLLEARETLESLRVFELRDYFKDDCVDAARSTVTRLEAISKKAVVIYPVLLEDRTELLVSLPSGMKRFSVNIGGQSMTRLIGVFRSELEKLTTREYLPHARELYDLLIRPLDEELASASPDTLVFVPDGPFRTIPMGALHDGKEFLIRKYAIAITPGLNLTDPRPLERKNLNVLALGLTEATQGFPALPFVSQELAAIHELYRSKLLLNEDFLLSGVEKSLREEHFTVVHIASHGQFKGSVDGTFLLTFDGKLTMDSLNQYVGLLKFREDPLELLTLSACDTASGDDRAALGLAGVAVKAGARSAVGTLWHINDRSSSMLVEEFYRQLQNPSLSRAAALQQAQLKMLNDRRYQHPGYWSPFLLINNWL